MARGVFRVTPIPLEEQYVAVSDRRLRMSLVALSNRYTKVVRELIYAAYQDDELAAIYRRIRASCVYDTGGKSKTHRKIFEFPNGYVFDFVDTVLTELYGPDWITNRRAWGHELVRPWWVISRI